MATYSEYKDSGFPWIGVVPSHWDIKPIRSFLSEVKELNSDESATLLTLSQYKGVNIRKGTEDSAISASESLVGYNVVHSGQFVMNIMLAWNGSYGVSDYDGVISPAYAIFNFTKNVCKRYYHYLWRTKAYQDAFRTRSKGIVDSRLRLYPQYFLPFYTSIPPVEEQEAIVKYLDKATAEIDKAIEAKERIIAALEERRKIIITEAVTRGINSNAPLRDSGIDWLGQIPAHWENVKLGALGTTINGVSNDSSYFGSGFPFVNYSDVYKNPELPSIVKGLAKSSPAEQKIYSVEEGDVFFTRTSETAEEIGFSSVCTKSIQNAVFAGFLIRFRPKDHRLIPNFSKYYFRASVHRSYFVKEMNLVIRASLSQKLLRGLPVLIPPIEEQNQIADYLDNVIGKINQLLYYQNKVVDLLRERKNIIINEVVTGKVKVI